MCKKSVVRLLCVVSFLVSIFIGATLAYADSSDFIVSGRLGATYDSKTGNVTAMVIGYCKGEAVTVGPVTWSATQKQFSKLRADHVAKIICGKDFALQKITRSAKNGQELVADVLIVKLN